MFRKHPNKTAREMSHENFLTIIEETNLTNIDKTILKSRFLNEIKYYDYKRDNIKIYYNTLRFIVTAGSIILPAILSIGQMDQEDLPDNFDIISYWSSWGISLLVTASNGFIQLFSLDKKYYDYSLTTEQLKSEASVLKTKVDLNTQGAKKIWQDILVQIEDNVNLKTLETIALIPNEKNGCPDCDSKSMKSILAYNQYKGGLKGLDDFLDSY